MVEKAYGVNCVATAKSWEAFKIGHGKAIEFYGAIYTFQGPGAWRAGGPCCTVWRETAGNARSFRLDIQVASTKGYILNFNFCPSPPLFI